MTPFRYCRALVVVGLMAALAIAPTADPARAATTFTVDSALDLPDNVPGDGSCAASTNSITTAGPIEPVCTLRAAVEEANALAGDDTIQFDPSIDGIPISVDSPGQTAIFISAFPAAKLTIDGNGPTQTLIDGCANFPNCVADRTIFEVADTSAEFRDLAIRGGRGSNAGGVFADDATIAFHSVSFEGNAATQMTFGGGAIMSNSSALSVDASTFVNNSSPTEGGAILSYQDPPGLASITNSTFDNNQAPIGGAISSHGAMAVAQSTFTSNDASNQGGAIATTFSLEAAGALLVEDSTFTQNAAENAGGAISKIAGAATVRRTNIIDNDVTVACCSGHTGAGISNAAGDLTVEDSLIQDGRSLIGGGVYVQAGTVSIVRSALIGNGATFGGAVTLDGGTLTLTNSTLSSNIAQRGPAIDIESPQPTTTRLNHVTVADNVHGLAPAGGPVLSQAIFVNVASAAHDFAMKNSVLKNAAGNCLLAGASPIFSSTGTISSDGTCPGSTQANPLIAPLTGVGRAQGHYPLPGSPLIDAVSDCTLIGGGAVADDQRSTARPQSSICEIGAIEIPQAGITPLFNQMPGFTGTGVRSIEHAGAHPFDTEAADDFVVPDNQQWSIHTVGTFGIIDGTPPQSFNVRFYAADGSLPGALIAERLNQPWSGAQPLYLISLDTPVPLTPGTYWLAVQANNPVNDQGWYWAAIPELFGSPAAWRNPSGTFAAQCTDWQTRGTTCGVLPALPDQVFELVGTLDSDADGCTDIEEFGWDPNFGGDRDPFDGFDYYDVTGDRSIDLGDTLLILQHFGHGPADDPLDPFLDRYVPSQDKPFRPAQATGNFLGIDLGDALANLQSFGHDCSEAP